MYQGTVYTALLAAAGAGKDSQGGQAGRHGARVGRAEMQRGRVMEAR